MLRLELRLGLKVGEGIFTSFTLVGLLNLSRPPGFGTTLLLGGTTGVDSFLLGGITGINLKGCVLVECGIGG